jgi:putative phosphoserine phosphatase/1-acylglycerol-3-phosphate O-acyltransferase
MMVHLFDVDYTIVRTSTVRDFMFEAMRRGVMPLRAGFLAPRFFLLYFFSIIRPGHFEDTFASLRGIAETEFRRIAGEVFRKKTQGRIDGEVARLIAELRERGEPVVLATSSFRTMLEPLAEHLGIRDIVSSELEFAGGLSTGRIKGEPAFGDGKLRKVLRFLASAGVAPGECVFYTDSPRDLPLLEAAGRAVAVNPQPKLRKLARERGWQIMDTVG